jgi:DNA-binding IclR family transcriptional regulator
MDDAVLAALVGLLEQLWRSERERPGKACSLAWLIKQSARPMSVLRRQLVLLVEAGWVAQTLAEEGGGTVALSDAGRQLCASLF